MPILSFWHWMAVTVVVTCAITPWIAYLKNRPVFLWFALGVLAGPIALVVLLHLRSLPRPPYRPPAAPGEMRMIE